MDKRSRTVAIALAPVCIVVGAIIWWGTTNRYAVTNESPSSAPEPDLVDASPPVTEANPVETVGREGHTTVVDEPWHRLAPEEVINSPDCRLVPGVAEAQGAAIVMVASAEEKIWFAVVDHRGVLFGDYLPFVPRSFNGVHAALGKRSDGSILAAVRSFRQGEVIVVHDGRWIVFGLETGGMVLNADTGKTVINVPFDPASWRRYGDPTGVHFLDGRLTLYRYKDAGSERTAEVYYPVSNTTQAWPAERTVVESVPRARIAGFQKPEDTDSRQEMAHPLKAPCAHPALSDNRALVGDGDRLTYRIPPDSAKAP